ncbi:MAG: 3-deoxy-8-phosphooctulonate synthase [Gammaproteobacteria bacterium]|nr:3-deoxy-8-phosphooctulonate synthase [Gammaproteobacteria bacterium]MCY4357237.1 3-deoxy-8-phosphooctulonate synthase [Gammaproteobacteria bacterium]
MTSQPLAIASLKVANDRPFTLFGGVNVLESRELALQVAGHFKRVTDDLGIPCVFKASFDKANRSSLNSYRGPGLDEGLRWLEEIKTSFDLPILTDVHQADQASAANEVADVIQLPAFLSRQTDLVTAMARTGAAINIKKAQFLAPAEMGHILHKFEQAGNQRLMLCERGSSFGYNNLVVDMLGFATLKSFGYPVLFDVTHSLQQPGALASSAGGRRAQVLELAKAGMSLSLAGLFLEAHPNPESALCDGPCALRLNALEPFLGQIKALDQLVKSQPPLVTV